jgi:hypothetical protein
MKTWHPQPLVELWLWGLWEGLGLAEGAGSVVAGVLGFLKNQSKVRVSTRKSEYSERDSNGDSFNGIVSREVIGAGTTIYRRILHQMM